jgi:predicted ArsR family transcriptional regulator
MAPLSNRMRQRFLTYFHKNHHASASELSRVFGITPSDARHHLRLLLSEGLVDVVELSKGAGKGRPVKVYGLSRLARGDNLQPLVDSLLKEWLGTKNLRETGEALEQLAERLVGDSGQDERAPLSRKLVQCVDLLNKMHYHSRWEAHASGPRIIFESCPYASVITTHPELCMMDKKILERYLGGNVEQLVKLEKGTRNVPVCVFSLINLL